MTVWSATRLPPSTGGTTDAEWDGTAMAERKPRERTKSDWFDQLINYLRKTYRGMGLCHDVAMVYATALLLCTSKEQLKELLDEAPGHVRLLPEDRKKLLKWYDRMPDRFERHLPRLHSTQDLALILFYRHFEMAAYYWKVIADHAVPHQAHALISNHGIHQRGPSVGTSGQFKIGGCEFQVAYYCRYNLLFARFTRRTITEDTVRRLIRDAHVMLRLSDAEPSESLRGKPVLCVPTTERRFSPEVVRMLRDDREARSRPADQWRLIDAELYNRMHAEFIVAINSDTELGLELVEP
jgi:hypothetical protein